MPISKSVTLTGSELKRAIYEGAKAMGKLEGMDGDPSVWIEHEVDDRDTSANLYRATITATDHN